MIILIDSGNSRLKLGCVATGDTRLRPEFEVVALDGFDRQGLARWIERLPQRPTLALGVNVAGQERSTLITTALGAYGCAVRWLSAQANALGLINAYRTPTQLGADRWVSLLGVLAHLPTEPVPFLLASFGSATTIDTVDADKRFVGGLILPGPAMMRTALAQGTAGLPLADGPVVAYPGDTHEAIASGIAAAQAGAVLRQWLLGCERYDKKPHLFVTGGAWPQVRQEVERLLVASGAEVPVYLPHPVLTGLATLARHGLDHIA